jgi:MFS family permease
MTSYKDLLQGNTNFCYLWSSEIISMFGDWFNLIASASLIGALTQSGTAIGGLFVVRMLAPFLVSPIAGVLADRYNRKHIMILTDLCRALVVLGFLLVGNTNHIWLFYILTAIQLGLSGFFVPARNAILPDLVSGNDLGVANALSSATYAVMQALGTALGGVISGVWGIYPTFCIDALSFLISALLCTQINYQVTSIPTTTEAVITTPLKQYLDGLSYLQEHIHILFTALHKGANALFITGGLQVLQVTLAKDYFSIGEGSGISIGLIFCATGIGTAIGPIIARRFANDEDRLLRLGLVWCYVISSLGLIIVACMGNFILVFLGILLRGIGGGIMWVFSTQLLMKQVSNQMRGRVFSTEYAFRTLMSATGAAMVSILIDTPLGISGVLWLTAAFSLIPAILWMLWLFASNGIVAVVHEPDIAGDR